MFFLYLFMYLFLIFSFMFLFLSLFFKIMKILMVLEWIFIKMESVVYDYFILIDWISLLFVGIVFLICSMVMYYSMEYMYMDKYIFGFYILIILFVLSMMMMIFSPHLLSILLGWDGLGLISYCLVIFYNNYFSFNSGMITFLSNRIGDIMFLMSIGLMVMFGSWNLCFNLFNLFIIIFMLILACMTKSAQYPFSVWLPAAMSAPTPISALVHSSTLVTAGVYIIIRFNMIIYMVNLKIFIMIFIFTMFMSGLMANFEMDLKKIIAYSTLSQLGFMMMYLFFGVWEMSFYHLLTHALFKSMLFLCSGIMIHCMHGNQDIRFMGSLNLKIPFVVMMFMISNLSLCGFPFLSGFYSKDLMLEYSYMLNLSMMVYFFLILSMLFTVSYSFRLLMIMFNNEFCGYKLNMIFEGFNMKNSLYILGFSSIIFGSLLNWIYFYDLNFILITFFEKIFIFILMFFGLLFGIFLSNLFFLKYSFNIYCIIMMFYLIYLYKEIYFNFLNLGLKFYLYFDNGWMEIYSFKFMFIYMLKYILSINMLNLFKFMNLFILFIVFLILFIFLI